MDFYQAVVRDRGREIINTWIEEAEKPDICCDVGEVLSAKLAEALRKVGIHRLFRYQYDAISSIKSGRDTVIVAGTGMGKTEAFLAPILESSLESSDSALILYPTKALARDQYVRIRKLADALGVRTMVYDGDTPQRERRLLYNTPPEIVVSNPDMVNQALIHVAKFREVLKRTKYLVLDDFHVYSGVFGSHMYYLVRRMKRFAKLTFVATSATVGNPYEFSQSLFGRGANVVLGPLGRRGKVIHMLVKPKFRPKWAEAARLASLCIEHGFKCLVFTDSHRFSEMIYRALYSYRNRAAVHRGGLSAEHRKSVEQAFKRGDIDVVIATPTLELGIDIGDVDVAVLASIPPSFNRYLQRVGRVGRRGQVGYVVQILGDDPISQYYANYPGEFFTRSPEPIGLEIENEEVTSLHLLAAAAESPLRISELTPFERSIAAKLVGESLIERSGFLKITPIGRAQLELLNMRGTPHVVKIKSGDRVIGHRELPMALSELHPGAVYMHGGETYRSKSLDLEKKIAIVEREELGHLVTYPLQYMDPQLVSVEEEGAVDGVYYQFGKLKITITTHGYVVRQFATNEMVGKHEIDPLQYTFMTKGVVMYLPPIRFSPNDREDWEARAKGYHATEHVLIAATEIAIGASKTDLGGVSYPDGVVVIYDSHIGGNGTSRLMLRNFRRVSEVALKIVKSCNCVDGCPKCVYSPYCGNNNEMLSRRNAVRILEHLKKSKAPRVGEFPTGRGFA